MTMTDTEILARVRAQAIREDPSAADYYRMFDLANDDSNQCSAAMAWIGEVRFGWPPYQQGAMQ